MVHWGLFVIGAGRGGLWWSQNGGARGNGELIAAQQGDYKVAPANDGARTFEGEGDVAFSASEGAEPAGKVDPARMPEEPAVTLAEREAAVKRSEEHTSELQSLMRISYAVFCLKQKKNKKVTTIHK